jgi:hypothetical protein
MRRGAILRLLAIVFAVVMAGIIYAQVSGDGSTSGTTSPAAPAPTRAPTRPASPPARVESGLCAVEKNNGAVGVKFDGPGAESACSKWAVQEGKAGEYWREIAVAYQLGNISCYLASAGLKVAVFSDDNDAIGEGQSICASFVGAGWVQTR